MTKVRIKSDLRDISLLIVEDGEDIINIMDRTFKMLVKDITLAKDGEEAIAAYNLKQPDAILTDLRMPNINGMDFIKHVRKTNKDIPIIMITAYELDLKSEDKELINEVFPKPINFMKLVVSLDKQIQDSKK